VNAGDPQLLSDRFQRRFGRAQVLGRDRERDLGLAALFAGLVLDDRVDVAVSGGEWAEEPGGGAGPVRGAAPRDPGFLGRMGDRGDEWVLHGLVFSDHKGTGAGVEAEAAMPFVPVRARVLDRA